MSSEKPTKEEAKTVVPAKGLEPYRQLYDLTRGFRGQYVVAFVLLAAAVGVMYVPNVLVGAAVDAAVRGRPEEASPWLVRLLGAMGVGQGQVGRLWIPGLLIVVFAALSAWLMYLKGKFAGSATEGLTRALRQNLYDKLQHLPLAWHDRHATGDLVQRCTSDVETLRNFYSAQTIEIARAVCLLVTVLPIMFVLDWRMALVAVGMLPIIVGFSYYFFNRVKTTFKAMDDAEGVMSAAMQENLTGIRVVRAFSRQEFEIERFDKKNVAHRDYHWGVFKVMSVFWSSSDLMCFMQLLAVLGYGVYSVQSGRISVGELLFFFICVNMYLWPIREMGRTLTEMGKAVVSVGRVHEILSTAPDPEPDPLRTYQAGKEYLVASPVNGSLAPLPERLSGAIEIRNVSFSHGPKQILSDVSLSIPAGQTLALLGPSGAGKTTLISLLLRFYEPSSGSITMDGLDLQTLPRKYVRSQFGVVMQEPFLFSKSLSENLRLGRPGATQAEIEEVARQASVHSSIVGFEKQYDTVVGERGVTLSGGQRQRVAIARALLRESPVVVLDDALSAVDTHTESLILEALRTRSGKHTTLLIAHRLSTLMHADQIAVLEEGKLVQLGTHAELVGQDGLYRRLWEIQTALEDDLKAELEQPVAV